MSRKAKIFAAIMLLLVFSSLQTWGAVYEIDPAHSSVSFKIRHLVSKTQGTFKTFSGAITYDEKEPQKSRVDALIEVGSIDTGVKKRDDHLTGEKDFFDAKQYPQMKFETVKISKVKDGGKRAEVLGKLTLHGVTKPVVLDVVIGGTGTNPFTKKPVIGFTGTTTIDRRQWGVTWNKEENGNWVLGNEVEITIEVEAGPKS